MKQLLWIIIALPVLLAFHPAKVIMANPAAGSQDSVVSRSFNQEKLEKIQKNHDYQEKERWSIWKLLNRKPRAGSTWSPSISPIFLIILKYLAILLIAALLIFIIIKLFPKEWLLSNSKLNEKKKYIIQKLDDEFHSADLDKLLQEALEINDYRLATRILFLKILQKLIKLDKISWKKDKTNHDYLYELLGDKHFNSFRLCSNAFERVWYGDYSVNEKNYAPIAGYFNKFQQRLDEEAK